MLKHRVYVLSDHKILAKSRNVTYFHLREVTKEGKFYVIAAQHANILRDIQDKKDDYHIAMVSKNVLDEYCKTHNLDLLYIDNCNGKVCDIYFDLLK